MQVANGAMAVTPPARERRELFVNTLAAWGWAQGTLVASVLVLPLLTHLMSKAEFGLWAQMLSLNTLATVADLGMSQVFLRRLASAGRSSESSLVRMAAAFYGTSGSILTLVLLAICLLPGGLLAPYSGKTQLPGVTAVAIIVAIAVNLAVQPYTLRVLARGRLDLERVFGAGPAVVGTIVTGVAAYWFGSALAVGVGYALVEVAFDVALIAVVRRSTAFKVEPSIAGGVLTTRWRDLLHESWGVLVIGVTPQLGLLIDIAVVGHIEGPAAVAIYAVCQRGAYLLPRFFSAFTESLFVTLCRAEGTDRQALAGHVAALSRVLVFSGLALTCAIVTVGARALTVVFGAGYGEGEAALVILAVAATIRAVYMPGLKRLQADAALGMLPRWFVMSVVAHIALAILLTMEWSLPGTSLSALLAALAFEAWPVALALRRHEPNSGASSAIALTPTGMAFAGGALVLLLAWYRLAIGGWVPLVSGVAALALGGTRPPSADRLPQEYSSNDRPWLSCHDNHHHREMSQSVIRPSATPNDDRASDVRVLYVAGFGRCGSTLLDRLLGQDPHYHSGGELIRLWRLWSLGGVRLCSCGAPVSGCPFWGRVEQRAIGSAPSTEVAQVDQYLSTSSRAQSLYKLGMPSARVRLLRHAPKGFSDMLLKLYRALDDTAGSEVIVGLRPKAPPTFILAQVRGIDLRVIHLVRDPRAVAHSSSRSPVPDPDGRVMPHWGPTKAGLLWLGINGMTGRVAKETALPYTRIRYEDLVRDTDRESRRSRRLDGARTRYLAQRSLTQRLPCFQVTYVAEPMRFSAALSRSRKMLRGGTR